jgi:hypothetical protein
MTIIIFSVTWFQLLTGRMQSILTTVGAFEQIRPPACLTGALNPDIENASECKSNDATRTRPRGLIIIAGLSGFLQEGPMMKKGYAGRGFSESEFILSLSPKKFGLCNSASASAMVLSWGRKPARRPTHHVILILAILQVRIAALSQHLEGVLPPALRRNASILTRQKGCFCKMGHCICI